MSAYTKRNTLIVFLMSLCILTSLFFCTKPTAPIYPPAAPSVNDSSYQIEGLRRWYLTGKTLPESLTSLQFRIQFPNQRSSVECWIDNKRVLSRTSSESVASCTISVQSLPADTHLLVLALSGESEGFAAFPFLVSAPLLVSISTDWESPDNSLGGEINNQSLIYQEMLHASHPLLKITHFIGPYTFSDTILTEERKHYLVDWHSAMNQQFGDEIGLHIHPYCSFVSFCGLSCCIDTPLGQTKPDSSGYATGLFQYNSNDLLRMFSVADSLFTAYGLDKPLSFRAGGWSANDDVLQALSLSGYLVDASKCNWTRWEYVSSCPAVAQWMQSQWPGASDTSQPYTPADVSGRQYTILEIPDNGLLVDQMSYRDMNEVLQANWQGGCLSTPREISFGYHPISFHEKHYSVIDSVLMLLDRYTPENGSGPVVYATMQEIRAVFKAR